MRTLKEVLRLHGEAGLGVRAGLWMGLTRARINADVG